MYYFLENDELIVKIDSFGAELKSVLSKDSYREYMWYGDGKYWNRTSPVLFPFVGSLKDKQYIHNGKVYPMGQHGFARDMEFALLSQSEGEIWFAICSDEETLEKYPFPFELQVGYKLAGRRVSVKWRVKNTGEERMYFSIGAHPAFLCPAHGEETKTGYKLYFEGADEIHHSGNSRENGLALDEDIVLPLKHGMAEITDGFFDRCTYIVENRQTGKIGIADPCGNMIVDMTFDMPLFAIWSPEEKNAPFICLEPWCGRCDRTSFEGELREREYTQVLESEEQFENSYEIYYHKL